MLQLHVWGENGNISIISPECRASGWLLELASRDVAYEIITSSNTNISEIHKLPVLINGTQKYQGFQEIADFINDTYINSSNGDLLGSQHISKRHQLINLALLNVNQSKIEYINQYNLYINTKNYEKYTRKQFQRYFPFPMMYNQPLKFYNNAQAKIKLLGFSTSGGFFNLSGGNDATKKASEAEIPQTEYINDETEEKEEVAISSLHEKQLIAKSKEKQALKETSNSIKCLNLIHEYLQHYTKIFEKNYGDSNARYGYIFDSTKISTSELLLFSYIYSLTYTELPDGFIANYLKIKYPEFLKFVEAKIEIFNQRLASSKNQRAPRGEETPSLWNEIKYVAGLSNI